MFSYVPLTTGFGWLVVLGLTALETVFQSISGRLPKSEKEKRKDRLEK